ncbi:hypothetical protein C2845_PM14G13500 [Panicum miliaceum]|uniref:Uncharacterized protein n=1 Tax=Panicum miliaceum TaxID=4540 RepID=A0A3L6PQI6_PANMI|nr:hypothetical protein C2845_PM14G13500 [Panicum miliaceum]
MAAPDRRPSPSRRALGMSMEEWLLPNPSRLSVRTASMPLNPETKSEAFNRAARSRRHGDRRGRRCEWDGDAGRLLHGDDNPVYRRGRAGAG